MFNNNMIIAFSVIGGFFITFFMLIFDTHVAPETKEPLMLLIGIIGAKFGTIVDYFFGDSKKEK